MDACGLGSTCQPELQDTSLYAAQCQAAALGYEVWDVTIQRARACVSHTGPSSTHKRLVGVQDPVSPIFPAARAQVHLGQSQSMVIVDWSNPAATPVYIRTHGLPGGQPSEPDLCHLASRCDLAHEHPNAPASRDGVDVMGTVSTRMGVVQRRVQILDRNKLLPAGYGGTFTGDPDNPTDDQLLSASRRMDMSPDQGGHTSMTGVGVAPKSLQCLPARHALEPPSPDVHNRAALVRSRQL